MEVLSCIEKFGVTRQESGGVTRLFLTKRNAKRAVRDLKKVIRTIEHAGGVSIMIDGKRVMIGNRKKTKNQLGG